MRRIGNKTKNKQKRNEQVETDLIMQKHSLKYKLIISYMGVALVCTILLSSLSYFTTKEIVTDKVSKLLNEVTQKIDLNMNTYLGNIEDTCSLSFGNENILLYDPINESLDDLEQVRMQSDIEDYLLSVSLLYNFTDFALIYEDESIIGKLSQGTNKQFPDGSLYKEVAQKIDETETKSTWFVIKDGDYNKIYFAKRIVQHGILVAAIYDFELDEILSDSKQGNMAIYLCDQEEKIIYANEIAHQTVLPENISLLEGNKELIISEAQCENGWRLITTMATKEVLKELKFIGGLTIVFAIIAMLSAACIGLVLARMIIKPIIYLMKKMRMAEEGDLTVEIETSRKDEIGQLSASFNRMMKEIRGLMSETTEVSSLVLQEAKKVDTEAEQIKEISSCVSLAVEDIANGTTDEMEELKMTAEMMEQLAEKINETINYVKEVEVSSDEAKEIGEASLETIGDLKDKTVETSKIINKVTEAMNVLTNSMVQIERIIELINNISEETNLLALNASIEAARAGEAGKGFAVVAGEISKLADQSNRSTSDIKKVIDEIYNEANNALKLIEESKEIFAKQEEAVEVTNHSFNDIIASTDTITNYVEGIESYMSEINRLKEKTLISTQHIVDITTNISANTEEVLASTEEQSSSAEGLSKRSMLLNEKVQELQVSLEKFTVNK